MLTQRVLGRGFDSRHLHKNSLPKGRLFLYLRALVRPQESNRKRVSGQGWPISAVGGLERARQEALLFIAGT
jgi:hypothetical protein